MVNEKELLDKIKCLEGQLSEKNQIINELNFILDGTSNVIIGIDNNYKIIVYNKAAERHMRIPKEKALGSSLKDICPKTPMIDIIESGQEYKGIFVGAGKTKLIANRVPIIRDKKIVGAVSTYQDITEIQEIMEELTKVKEYKKLLEIIIDTAFEGIIVVNTQGFITMINQTYADILGITREEAIGRHVTEIIENSNENIVAQTGEAKIGIIQRIKGQEMVVTILPIEKDNKHIGAVSKIMFKNTYEVKELASNLNVLKSEVDYYRNVLESYNKGNKSSKKIIGNTECIINAINLARKVANNNSSVLIRGESGTGKELFANLIHLSSKRRNSNFIKFNCAAIPETLLESELFGYEEGAFTGTKKGGKVGKFELAKGGTIFLDEIGDMSLNMQAKLLRVLQEREIDKIGGEHPVNVDFRLISATHKNLEELIDKGLFREDLYYRLNVVEIVIPSLRERKEDIPLIIKNIISDLSKKIVGPIPEFDEQSMNLLLSYEWPGNVRELENVIERSIVLADNGVIGISNLPSYLFKNNHNEDNDDKIEDLKYSKFNSECYAIKRALNKACGNRSVAANLLGISRSTLYEKIKKYKIRL